MQVTLWAGRLDMSRAVSRANSCRVSELPQFDGKEWKSLTPREVSSRVQVWTRPDVQSVQSVQPSRAL